MSLYAYIDSVIDRPFQWGTHDCLHFVNRAIRAQGLTGFCDDWLAQYHDKRGAVRLIARQRRAGYARFEQALAERMVRAAPPVDIGCVVARPAPGVQSVLGVSLGMVVSQSHAAFVGYDGIEFLRFTQADSFWCPA